MNDLTANHDNCTLKQNGHSTEQVTLFVGNFPIGMSQVSDLYFRTIFFIFMYTCKVGTNVTSDFRVYIINEKNYTSKNH